MTSKTPDIIAEKVKAFEEKFVKEVKGFPDGWRYVTEGHPSEHLTWLTKSLTQVAEESRRETADSICNLLDDIELEQHDSSLEEWRQYKKIRNRIRDRFVLSTLTKKEEQV